MTTEAHFQQFAFELTCIRICIQNYEAMTVLLDELLKRLVLPQTISYTGTLLAFNLWKLNGENFRSLLLKISNKPLIARLHLLTIIRCFDSVSAKMRMKAPDLTLSQDLKLDLNPPDPENWQIWLHDSLAVSFSSFLDGAYSKKLDMLSSFHFLYLYGLQQ